MLDIFNKNRDKKVIELLKNKAFLVDVRTPSEYAEGTADGAVSIPLQSLPQNLDKFHGKEEIIVFCRSGNRSGQAKRFLEQNGISNVVNGGGVGHVIQVQKQVR